MTSVETQLHAVRARLRDGWALQPCRSLRGAAALFDRLRDQHPTVAIQRIQDGRVVESTMPQLTNGVRPEGEAA